MVGEVGCGAWTNCGCDRRIFRSERLLLRGLNSHRRAGAGLVSWPQARVIVECQTGGRKIASDSSHREHRFPGSTFVGRLLGLLICDRRGRLP